MKIKVKKLRDDAVIPAKAHPTDAGYDLTAVWSGWNNTDIAVVKADGKEVHNITDSGYSDSNGKWVLGGKAILFESDRAGYRSHGSWGAEEDAYLMFHDFLFA